MDDLEKQLWDKINAYNIMGRQFKKYEPIHWIVLGLTVTVWGGLLALFLWWIL